MPRETFYEGQTATNDAGDTLVYNKGRWYPQGQAPAATPQGPKLSPQDATYLSDLHDAASRSLNTAQQAKRFVDINQHTETGGRYGLPLVGGMLRDVHASHDPDFADMEAISSAVAPGLRPPGSGSSSDKDVKFYSRGFTNTEVPLQTNVATEKRLHAQSDHDAAHAAFLDSWYQHRGTLLGGESAFAKYWAGKQQAGGGGGAPGVNVALPGGGTAIVRPR